MVLRPGTVWIPLIGSPDARDWDSDLPGTPPKKKHTNLPCIN